jgi:branched-chain amino acid transport system substrate-binding protein
VDDHGVPEEAVRLVEQLVGEQVVAIVGPVTDATTIAAAGVVERFKVLLISPGATGTLPYGGHFVFRTALPARTLAGAAARYLVETLAIRRIAVVHDSNDYGTTVAVAFDEAIRARGATITSRRLYRDGDTDFTRHVRGALGEHAQAVFLAGYPDEGALFLRQLRAVAPELVVAGTDALYSNDILSWAGAAASGLYVTTGFVAGTSLPLVRDFVAKYRQKYGRVPDQYAAQSYDAVRALAFAMRRVGFDRQKIRDTIATLRRFPGVTGEVSFDRWGDPVREVIIARVKGGTFVQVSP